MKKFEIIVGSIFVSGTIIRIWDIPGAISLAGISSLLLSFFYLFFSFFLLNQKRFRDIFKRSTYSGIGVYRAIVSILIGWSLFVYVISVLANMMDWVGGWFLIFGLMWLFMCCLILFFGMQGHKEFVVRCFKRIFIIIIIGFIALMIFSIPQMSDMM